MSKMKKFTRHSFIQSLAFLVGLSLFTQTPLANENRSNSGAIQQAIISTPLGEIEIELYSEQAPKSVANFIKYIEAGAFNEGRFYRVVRLDNDNGSPKIEVIQGGANVEFKDFAAIELEATKQTGIKHLSGVLSMARGAPDTATSEFFICIGAQPSLDFGGLRNPDGQGFAAFGRVIKGMHIVKKIHLIRDALEVEDNYVKGQILAKPVSISRIQLTKD
jgi:peptidyl-prolyl cis-trans isomerase A (cyclophilin A)